MIMKCWRLVWLFLGLGCIAQADSVPNLFVTDFVTNKVFQYDGSTGAPVNNPFVSGPAGAAGLNTLWGLSFGPDDNLYVASRSNNQVLKYNGSTGAFLGVFVGGAADTSGLAGPTGLVFGPDGNLYVASGNGFGSVLEYDGSTGEFIKPFVRGGSAGLSSPGGLAFGPDNNLYVASEGSNSVLKYDGSTGAFLGTFVTGHIGQGCLPDTLAFGPDGNLSVGMASDCIIGPASKVSKYDGTTGTFLSVIDFMGGVTLGIAFGPDGNLYVAESDSVLRFNGSTGSFIDKFVSSGGGLVAPTNLTFGPSANSVAPEPSTYFLAGPLLLLLGWRSFPAICGVFFLKWRDAPLRISDFAADSDG
jgi:DNA-binding beta-propeller fold protein YncE